MIRLAEEADIAVLTDLEKTLFLSDPWNEQQFLYEMKENPFSKIFVEEEGGTIIGYCDLWVIYEQAQIANIAVRKENQKHGTAQRMMERMEEYAGTHGCETVSLEVRVSNTPAIGLYVKNGFIQVSIRKKYYSDGEDAYLMIKPIGGLYDTVISD